MSVVFCAIEGPYDSLKEPFVSEGWEYVCFTDQPIESDVWDIRPLNRPNRHYKINAPFNGLCLWVDGSIEIVGDLNQFASEVPNWFSIWKHPHRGDLFDEFEAIVKLKGVDGMEANTQALRYLEAGMPRNYGLAACGVMLRDMSDKAVRKLCADWWEEFKGGVSRDQVSLPYVFWRNGYKLDLFSQDVFNKYFNWLPHKK